MKKFILSLLTAIVTFSLGVIIFWAFSTSFILDRKAKETIPILEDAKTKPQLNGELEVYYVGSYEEYDVITDKFIVINNSPYPVTYKDYAMRGVENQTATWFRRKRTDKPSYIGKAFCGVGLEKVNFDKQLLSGESKLFEVEIYNEKALQYEIGFSIKFRDETESKIIWATVNKQKIVKK